MSNSSSEVNNGATNANDIDEHEREVLNNDEESINYKLVGVSNNPIQSAT